MPEEIFDDTINTPKTLLVNSSNSNEALDHLGDEDWFKTTLTAGHVYALTMEDQSGGAIDPFLSIYDSLGNVVDSNDDIDVVTPGVNDNGLNAGFFFKPETTGTYYIGASSLKNNDLGDYSLALQELATSAQSSYIGGSEADVIHMESGENFKDDIVVGRGGDDDIHGFRGADILSGGDGQDIVRGGNGQDILTGGDGADYIFGGFGKNTFLNSADGSIDRIVCRSDQFAYNYVYDQAGNNPNGEKVDTFYDLDAFDQIWIDGVDTADIQVIDNAANGIEIYTGGFLEAVYVGNDLDQNQIAGMTFGFDSTVAPLPIA